LKQALGVVVVTYNSAAVIKEALQSIDEDVNCVVVDNCSTDDTVDRALACGAQVVRLDANQGFGAACNIGAYTLNTPFVLFLNPDARLRPGALRHLVEAALERPEWVAVNPQFRTSQGNQWYRRKSLLLTSDANRRLKQPPSGRQEIEVISGATLLVRRNPFLELGGFDENIFLYFEDDDLAVRVKKAGWKLGYAGDAVVEHIGNSSSQWTPHIEELKSYHFMKSAIYVTTKHGVKFNLRKKLYTSYLNWLIAACFNSTQGRAKYSGYIRAILEASSVAPVRGRIFSL